MRRIFSEFIDIRQLFRKPTATAASGDRIAFQDVSDGRKLKNTTFADVAAFSGLVLISAQTPNSVASVAFTGLDSTYDTFMLAGHLVPETDDVDLWLRTDSNGGASYDANANDYATAYRAVAATANEATANTNTEIRLAGAAAATNSISNAAEGGVSFVVFFSLGSAAQFPMFDIKSSWTLAADTRMGTLQGAGSRLSAAAIDAVQVLMESGDFSGQINLYGLKKA